MSEKVDNPKLAQIVENCFMLSMDNRLTPERQGQFGLLAEHLRSLLLISLSKTFDDRTPELIEANQKIKAVNTKLKNAADDLARIADTVEQVSKLVSVIDDLVKIPLVFV